MDVLLGLLAVVYLLAAFMVLGVLIVSLYGFIVVAYILEGKTLSAIARRRGIARPWLAWVPVGNSWLLGSISDQYRYVSYGQVRNRRKLLPWLSAALYVALTAYLTVTMVWMVVSIISGVNSSEDVFMVTYLGGFLLFYGMMFAFYGIAALNSVFHYMAYYDLFRSCDPGKSLVYLLVSIFASHPLPFFLYSCRDKDLGMPPRMEEPAPEPVVPCE